MKTLLFNAVSVACTALMAAAVGPNENAIPLLDFRHRTLPNGLEIYTLEDHATPTAAIAVWYHVGSKDDPPDRSGFAHLFEHLMFKGTKNTAPETLDRLTEDVGGANNAFTQDDVTVYHEVIPSNHLRRLLWAEADRMGALTVDDKNFASEREVVKQEYLQRVDAEPYGKFEEEVQKKSFTTHPYHRTTIGSIPDLNAATLPDVRKFHTTFYRPDNATLVVSGDFDPKELDQWIDEYFAGLPKPETEVPRVTIKEPPRDGPKSLEIKDDAVPLPAFAVTYLAPDVRHEDALALDLAMEILTGGESSRLYNALVYEQQVAQSVSGYADLREDAGLLAFEIILASGRKLEAVETAFLEQVQKLVEKPPSEFEIKKAKNRLLAGRLEERETNAGRVSAIGYAAVLLHDAARVNTDLVKLQAVTAEQIQTAFRKIVTDQNRLVISVSPDAAAPEERK